MRQRVRTALSLVGVALLCSCHAQAGRADDRAERLAASCKQNAIHIDRKIEVHDLYVDRPYLRILLKPYDETYGLDDLVNFLFETKLNSIETTNTDASGNPLASPTLVGSRENYIRLSIKPLGHVACKAYDYPVRYPSLAMPWLRKLGLKEDRCVAIETSSTITSKTGIFVDEELLDSEYKGLIWQKRLHVALRDSSGTSPQVAASMVDVYAGGGGGKGGRRHWFPCDTRDSQVKAFRDAFSAKGNPDIAPPTLVEVAAYEVAAPYPMADERWLGSLHWVARPGKVWSSNVINEEGTVWVEPRFTKQSQGYTFNSLSDGKLYSSPVPVPLRGQGITGLASTAQGYAIISSKSQRATDTRHILEFSVQGRLLSIRELSNAQYDALAGAK